ncbi:lysylphosphatidylglycerol synthase transmembrane domain-containing protein [Desulfothermus okinawensis]
MSSKLKFLGLLLSAVFLALSLHSLDIHNILNAFKLADYRFIPIAVSVFLFSLYIRSILWSYLLQDNTLSVSRLFLHLMVGLMANNILPARLGEFVRAYTVGSEWHISRTKVFSSIIIERALDVFWLSCFVLTAFILDLDSTWPMYLGRFTFCLLIFLFLVLLFLYKFQNNCIELLIFFVPNRFKNKFKINLEFYISMIFSGMESIKGIRILGALFLSFMCWALWVLFLWFSLLIFHIHIGFWESLLLTGIINLGVMIPSAPGYIGTFQFVCVKGLSLFNISKDIGFSFSILFHSLWYIPTTVIGIISMYLLGQNILKKNLNEIKKYE